MKFQLLSDLHLEFFIDGGFEFADRLSAHKVADTLILAGDIGLFSEDLIPVIRESFCKNWESVIFVPGNHEYYNASTEDHFGYLQELSSIENLIVLDNTSAYIGGIRIFGGTLWFPTIDVPLIKKILLSDYSYIHGNFEEFAQHQCEDFYKRIDPEGADLVITHHAPSRKSIAPQWQNSTINEFFVTPILDDTIHQSSIKVWAHGHTHSSVDYTHKNTRVVANPRGYPRNGHPARENITFDPKFSFEIVK